MLDRDKSASSIENTVIRALVCLKGAEILITTLWYDREGRFYKEYRRRADFLLKSVMLVLKQTGSATDPVTLFAVGVLYVTETLLNEFDLCLTGHSDAFYICDDFRDWANGYLSEFNLIKDDAFKKLDNLKPDEIERYLPEPLIQIMPGKYSNEIVDVDEAISIFDMFVPPANESGDVGERIFRGISLADLKERFPACMKRMRDVYAVNKNYYLKGGSYGLDSWKKDAHNFIDEQPLVILEKTQRMCAKHSINTAYWATVCQDQFLKYPLLYRVLQLIGERDYFCQNWVIFCRLVLSVLELPKTIEEAKLLLISARRGDCESLQNFTRRLIRYRMYYSWRKAFDENNKNYQEKMKEFLEQKRKV